MFSAGELAAMTATVEGTLGPDSGLGASIVLHRGATQLAAQDARLVRPGGQSGTTVTDGTEGEQTNLKLVGKPDMNIRARDRFAHEGQAYEVVSVEPQRQIKTVAAVRLVQ